MLKGEHSAILSTFIKLPFVIEIFVLSIFEWPFYTGFTVDVFLFHSKRRHWSRDMRFQTMWYVPPAKPQINLCIRAVRSEPLLVA